MRQLQVNIFDGDFSHHQSKKEEFLSFRDKFQKFWTLMTWGWKLSQLFFWVIFYCEKFYLFLMIYDAKRY
jgi:hypothetical protein